MPDYLARIVPLSRKSHRLVLPDSLKKSGPPMGVRMDKIMVICEKRCDFPLFQVLNLLFGQVLMTAVLQHVAHGTGVAG